MRWIWIDKFCEFESGARGVAVKNVTLAEELFKDHLPGYPVFPPTLMIEGMAQTAGILVGEARQFQENVILAKVRSASFDGYARPGDQIRYEATIESMDEHAAATRGAVFVNGEPVGQVDLMFSHVNKSASAAGLPEHNFVFTPEFMRLFDAIRGAAGSEVGISTVDRTSDDGGGVRS
jgi:3-hydroxyacyl-[acyl-carrier-protein] dehydratase